MKTTTAHRAAHPFALMAAVVLLAGCGDRALGPGRQLDRSAPGDLRPQDATPASLAYLASLTAEQHRAISTLRRVTARYHDVDAAIADEFVFLHPCEVRPGEGAVAALYIHPGHLLDGQIDPERPDALLYAPTRNGRLRLVGVELAVFYDDWPEAQPPHFLGVTFQREDEFQVFGLHVWVWQHNPNGLFAEANPHITCGTE